MLERTRIGKTTVETKKWVYLDDGSGIEPGIYKAYEVDGGYLLLVDDGTAVIIDGWYLLEWGK